jgi:hypothetical protein
VGGAWATCHSCSGKEDTAVPCCQLNRHFQTLLHKPISTEGSALNPWRFCLQQLESEELPVDEVIGSSLAVSGSAWAQVSIASQNRHGWAAATAYLPIFPSAALGQLCTGLLLLQWCVQGRWGQLMNASVN